MGMRLGLGELINAGGRAGAKYTATLLAVVAVLAARLARRAVPARHGVGRRRAAYRASADADAAARSAVPRDAAGGARAALPVDRAGLRARRAHAAPRHARSGRHRDVCP